MKYYGITDKGKLRKTNQDSYVIATNEAGDVFAMVCDGIGGGKGGDVASRLAINHFSMAFSQNTGFVDEGMVRAWLMREIKNANTTIWSMGLKYPELKGMGTTMTGVLLTSVGRYVVNIGDSRTYTYDANGIFRQVTTDHTLVNDMLKHGDITPEQAVTYPHKNVLTNALGVWQRVHEDIIPCNGAVGGFLLCSDGLHGYVPLAKIRSVVLDREMDPALRARKLWQSAMDAGGYDNITVVLIDLEGEETHAR